MQNMYREVIITDYDVLVCHVSIHTIASLHRDDESLCGIKAKMWSLMWLSIIDNDDFAKTVYGVCEKCKEKL